MPALSVRPKPTPAAESRASPAAARGAARGAAKVRAKSWFPILATRQLGAQPAPPRLGSPEPERGRPACFRLSRSVIGGNRAASPLFVHLREILRGVLPFLRGISCLLAGVFSA